MKDLQVKTKMPSLSFDYEGLKTWAVSIVEQYDGVVVTPENIPPMREELAGINKLKKALEAARIETKKKIMVPVSVFESQVKEVCDLFDKTYRTIKDQIDKIEAEERESRRHEVQFLIDCTIDDLDAKDLGLTIEIDPSWLTKSATKKSIRAAVELLINNTRREIADQQALAQAKKDRLVAIEQAVAMRNEQFGEAIAPSTFAHLSDVALPLADAMAQIDHHYQGQRDTKIKQAMSKTTAPTSTAPRQRPQEKMFSLTISCGYRDSKKEEVEAALEKLKSVTVNFKAGHREVYHGE